MENQTTIRSEIDLKLLAEKLKDGFSFSHNTIADARKTINAGIYTFVYDATTFLPYHNNLNYAEGRKLDSFLVPFYRTMKENREVYKELCERRILFRFLVCAPEQYQNCVIEKSVRPDFILYGENKIGIEITELTTPYDKIFTTLTRQIHENNLSSDEEIRNHIKRYYKKIENRVEIEELDGNTGISTDVQLIDTKRIHFAEEIKWKYEKYKDEIGEFNEFIILGDAASGSGLEISERSEVQEVIDHLLKICPDIINVTIVIAWREAEHQENVIHSWYCFKP